MFKDPVMFRISSVLISIINGGEDSRALEEASHVSSKFKLSHCQKSIKHYVSFLFSEMRLYVLHV